MSEFEVRTSTGSYEVTIARRFVRRRAGRAAVTTSCSPTGSSPTRSLMPALPAVFVDADEQHKNLFEVDRILGEFSDHGLTRGGSVVALGGGVVQDLGTFAASVYMRGDLVDVRADDTHGDGRLVHRREELAQRVAARRTSPATSIPRRRWWSIRSSSRSLAAEDVVAGLGEAVKIAFCAGPEVFDVVPAPLRRPRTLGAVDRGRPLAPRSGSSRSTSSTGPSDASSTSATRSGTRWKRRRISV